jgi:tRNA nucleotidyltransferase (CCA-adding enzyme)
MEIILTHEQADFDAVAALLAASLLDDSATPVLPRKLNRNARAFTALYALDLPFVEARDLQVTGEISQITLVDTQSLITLKGFSPRTRVNVIDHHMKRENLDPSWNFYGDRVGAVTTLLVENLQEKGTPLTEIQATLLLLGIYEDCGSLSYASTTARDVRCAAYLIDQGANLSLTVNYLNPPLSDEQRQVYHQLVEAAQSHLIHGMRMVIATAAAVGLVEEISSIAHKMRDLLEPDGLIIIVATAEGYRLVMRSTTDHVNVASLAAHFGGGGHERAAAALLQRPSGQTGLDDTSELTRIAAEVLRVLPAHITPAVTVRALMSRKPRVISPLLSAAESLKLMQRYGYEGFPVVENGKVVGLLTRRAVDRALSHKLDLPARSLMDAGDFSVLPTDTLERIQELMAETGWGQIPVVSPDNGQVIGIVTRTDLLKSLHPAPKRHPHHLASRLEEYLPSGQLALLKLIADRADAMGMTMYIVGGPVRDLLLDHKVVDLDIVVEGDAIQLSAQLVETYGGRVTTHHRFGTAKWYLDRSSPALSQHIQALDHLPESLDLISARTEFYEHPTALPSVERSSIKLDLHRRDFTMNTMAVRLDGRHYGELLDPYGGYADLKRGLIRVLHSLSFIDDPTRAIRAVRFEGRFGFKIEERTLQLMQEAETQLRTITGERIRHELDLVMNEDHASAMLQRLSGLGVLASIHPSLTWQADRADTFDSLLAEPSPPGWQLPAKMNQRPIRQVLAYGFWWMSMPVAEIEAVGSRLRLPADVQRVSLQAGALLAKIDTAFPARPSQLTDLLDPLQPAAIRCAHAALPAGPEKSALEEYMRAWRHIQPGVDGNHLRALKLPAGPVYARILQQLRHAWLDGQVTSPAEEASLLASLVDQYTHLHAND